MYGRLKYLSAGLIIGNLCGVIKRLNFRSLKSTEKCHLYFCEHGTFKTRNMKTLKRKKIFKDFPNHKTKSFSRYQLKLSHRITKGKKKSSLFSIDGVQIIYVVLL